MNKREFSDRAASIGLDLETRNKIYGDDKMLKLLEENFGKFFQRSHCHDVVSGKVKPIVQKPESLEYQQAFEYPQYVYAEQEPVWKKSHGNNGLITAALAAAIIMVLFAAFSVLRGNHVDPTDTFVGSFSDSMSEETALTFPETCNIRLGLNDGKILLDPSKPVLSEYESIICFKTVDYDILKALQKTITISGKETNVNGVELLGLIVSNNTAVSVGKKANELMDDNTNEKISTALNHPEVMVNINGGEPIPDLLFVRLPTLNIATTQPTPTPTYQMEPTQRSQAAIPTTTPVPPTQAVAMAMEVLENTPTSVPQPEHEAYNTAMAATAMPVYEAYGVPTLTPGTTPFPSAHNYYLDWFIQNILYRYSKACSYISVIATPYENWPRDDTFQVYLGNLCMGGGADGNGQKYGVVFVDANGQSLEPYYVPTAPYQVYITRNPNPQNGPARKLPGTSYYIQPFNP